MTPSDRLGGLYRLILLCSHRFVDPDPAIVREFVKQEDDKIAKMLEAAASQDFGADSLSVPEIRRRCQVGLLLYRTPLPVRMRPHEGSVCDVVHALISGVLPHFQCLLWLCFHFSRTAAFLAQLTFRLVHVRALFLPPGKPHSLRGLGFPAHADVHLPRAAPW